MKAVDKVTSPWRFTQQRQQEVIAELDSTSQQTLSDILQTEHTELRREAVRDMHRKEWGFLAGDWFKCSSGQEHLFHSREHINSRKSPTSASVVPPCPKCEEVCCDE